METSTYAVESEVERTHWWFDGRRRLFSGLIDKLALPQDARILDIGSSTGTNLRMLGEMGFTQFEGMDMSDEAIRWCAHKGLGKVTKGDVCAIPFPDGSFDLVLATDIIEHVDDDAGALREITRITKPGGKVLITVPAFQSLWGLQDDVSHHKRRYRARQVMNLVGAANLRPRRAFHFNYILFLPIFIARLIIRRTVVKLRSENEINSPLVNRILGWIFRFDVATAPRIRPPFGVSFLVLADVDGPCTRGERPSA